MADGVSDLAAALVEDPGNAFRVSRVGGQRGPVTPEDLLDQRAVVTCLNVKPQTVASTAKPFKLSNVKIGRWKLKLRGDQQSLRADVGGEGWKEAQAAQLSFAGDEIEESNKVTAKATLGLDSGYVPVGQIADFRLIPYIKFDSEFAEAPGQENDVDKLAFGLLGEFFHVGDLSHEPHYPRPTISHRLGPRVGDRRRNLALRSDAHRAAQSAGHRSGRRNSDPAVHQFGLFD